MGKQLQNKIRKIIQDAKKKAIRIITFSQYTAWTTRPLFEKLQLLDIHQINDLQSIPFMFDFMHDRIFRTVY